MLPYVAESGARFRHIGRATSGVPHRVGGTWGGPHGVVAIPVRGRWLSQWGTLTLDTDQDK